MPLFPAALLSVLAALPASALDPREWPLTPEASVRIEAENARACAAFSAALDKVEGLRTAYKDAPDRDAALAAWAAALADVPPLRAAAEETNGRHRKGLADTDLFVMMKAVGAVRNRESGYEEVAPEYKAINRNENTMDVRTKRLVVRFGGETARLEEASAARALEREREAETRLMLAGGGALLLALLGAAVWARRRPRI
ncbi:hypothetical protein EPO15_13830 [bacterium]|nr:MAG: hypothetical protein EPO15_13830 [bacterium]